MSHSFTANAYPEPAGYAGTAIQLGSAGSDKQMGEFVLPYDAMRSSCDPDPALLKFQQSTYEAAANCARWDRGALETPTK